ncbi:hypothetical protein CLOM621_08943 [Clostridium sp. M62/1]|nr:hypothetical protein CLOM621_08943 [Clostridium sp. M62/1]
MFKRKQMNSKEKEQKPPPETTCRKSDSRPKSDLRKAAQEAALLLYLWLFWYNIKAR